MKTWRKKWAKVGTKEVSQHEESHAGSQEVSKLEINRFLCLWLWKMAQDAKTWNPYGLFVLYPIAEVHDDELKRDVEYDSQSIRPKQEKCGG